MRIMLKVQRYSFCAFQNFPSPKFVLISVNSRIFFSILIFKFWFSISDGQRCHGYPRGRHHRGRDQYSTTGRRRCGNPTSHSLRSLLQNAHFLPLLRRNALRYVQAGPEMRGLRAQFPQKMRFQDPQRLLEPEEKAATFLQPQLL